MKWFILVGAACLVLGLAISADIRAAARDRLAQKVEDKSPSKPGAEAGSDDKKPDEKKPGDKTTPPKPDDKKPDDKVATAPMPKDVKPKDVTPAGAATVSGKVTLAGKPLGDGDVTFVSLDQPKPKVFTAAIKADGTFRVAEAVPPGKYAGMVSGTGVPAKYNLANTAGLMFEFAAGANATDLVLK